MADKRYQFITTPTGIALYFCREYIGLFASRHEADEAATEHQDERLAPRRKACHA